MLSKFLQLIKSEQHTVFLGICITLISIISYNLGQINGHAKPQIKISSQNNIYQASAVSALSKSSDSSTPNQTVQIRDLQVVVSKNSATKKYHYAWCLGAKKIKEENKIWFASSQEAESKGYALAGNCQL